MRGELYVTQLIRLSEAAETLALSLRPPGAARHASILEELVSLPLDQAEGRFADLAARLPAMLESEPPPRLAERPPWNSSGACLAPRQGWVSKPWPGACPPCLSRSLRRVWRRATWPS